MLLFIRAIKFIKNVDLSKKLGDNARKLVLQKYDWRLVIKACEELWNELGEIAQRIPSSSKYKYIFCTRYFQDYMHYPTRILDDEDQISITSDGMGVLEESTSCSIYDEMLSVLSFDILHEILELLVKPTSLGYIKELLSQKYDVSTHDIVYHVMWMLKNNLLELQ